MVADSHMSPFASVDNVIIALMRLILALAALLIIYLDPVEPDRYVTITYATLASYVAYSMALYVLAWRRSPLLPASYAHWIDVGWYVALIGLSSGPNSVFFFFFLFAILVVSFRFGFAPGLRVTLISALCFTTVGWATAPSGTDFELDRFLLRPVYLLVFGYMMACWGEAEIAAKRRLIFLKELSTLSNPRLDVDRMLGTLLQRLHGFYNAATCLLVTATDSVSAGYRVYGVRRQQAASAAQVEAVPEEVARCLLALLPAEQAVLYRSAPRFWTWWRTSVVVLPHTTAIEENTKALEQVSNTLAAKTFITVPFRSRSKSEGRLYLTAQGHHTFEPADLDFLAQVVEYLVPVLDNFRLVDRLASDAAEMERQRIARDLHDSVIQPYIGLQMGLTALRRKLQAGTDVSTDIDQLIHLTNVEINDLRCYAGGLRDVRTRESGLLPTLRRFARRFTEATGIAVQIEVNGNISINDRLAAEVFQMVAEGLSNIRRHTISTQARIELAGDSNRLELRIANDGTPETFPVPFTPRSLTERAEALGGGARVEWTPAGSTVVIIDIPL
jgi:signal transduction histidine kinase